MQLYLNIAEVVVAVALIIAVMVQVRGAGAGLFGGGQTTFRTRRGVDLLLFKLTILLGCIFIALSIISLLLL